MGNCAIIPGVVANFGQETALLLNPKRFSSSRFSCRLLAQ